jgi:hypothetical protein
MACQVYAEAEAVDRLAELGLSLEQVERIVRRADADASMCTPFDPPIMEGLTRWARTNRYLREELAPAGWQFDNPRNFPRTIHPSGEYAITATTGDDLTGLADLLPTTKYAKGYATTEAVAQNGQPTLDFGDFDFSPLRARGEEQVELSVPRTWFLLFHLDAAGFRVELSLPDAITDGRITRWAQRIVLPPFPRDDDRLADLRPAGHDASEDDSDSEVVVAVSRR